MNFLKTHKAWLITLAAGLVAFFTPSVNAWIAAHPHYDASIGAIWSIAMVWAKSPRQ